MIGKDPLACEALWDQMHRSNRHSRRGHFLMAISAVLGGPTRPSVEAYGSCLGFSVEPEPLRQNSAELKGQGFRHQKWFIAYGPGSNKHSHRIRLTPSRSSGARLLCPSHQANTFTVAWRRTITSKQGHFGCTGGSGVARRDERTGQDLPSRVVIRRGGDPARP